MKKTDIPFLSNLSRREALALGISSTAALALAASTAGAVSDAPLRPSTSLGGPGHVVKVHMPGMRQGLFPHPDAAQKMVETAVMTLSRKSDIHSAWREYVKPTDKVGIKINCLGTRMVSSMKEVVDAIARGIIDAGVPAGNIVIFDMFASNMMGGRYDQKTTAGKVRVLAHKEYPYESTWTTAGNARVRFSTLFSEADTIINVPVIKDHDLAGVTCCMKNVTFGCVEKPHLNHGIVNEALCHLWALEDIRRRVKLNIIDGSTILYDGGPKYNRNALEPHECIYATTDPVAMDATAADLVENLRARNGLRTLAEVRRPPLFLDMAAKMGLGIADTKIIRLETVDMQPFVGATA